MNLKLFSILLIISVYTDAVKYQLRRHKIQYQTLEESIRFSDWNRGDEKLTRPDVNLLINSLFLDSDNKTSNAELAIETTSSDLWVISPDCKSAFCSSKPGVKVNGAGVSTAENGLVRGTPAKTLFGFGTFIVGNIKFTSADYVDRVVEKRLSPTASGALGLGPQSVMMSAIKPNNIISLSVKPGSGDLFINEVPAGHADRIRSLSKSSWKISLGHITSSLPPIKSWCDKGCVAEIDTTFSGISGPANDINDLNAYLGADEDGSIDCYKIKETLPLIFYISGQRYKLEAKNFIIQEDRDIDPFSNKCKTQFKVDYTFNGSWRLGLAFLQQFKTTFIFGDDSSNNFISFYKN